MNSRDNKMEFDADVLMLAKQVIATEVASLQQMSERMDDNFRNAIAMLRARSGRLAVIGMGKSGIIGKKIAATLASTGTSAYFVHPGEAFHGDLGMIRPADIALMISNSGETEEIIRLIPFMQWQQNKIIAMTGNVNSTLARNADAVLDISVEREACNNNLAPTSSTTATLVMGDALAVTLSSLNNFQPADFARFHPGGNLGRRLLTRVQDVMHGKELPVCEPGATFREVVHIITLSRMGVAVVMREGNLAGLITDGDLRRALEHHTDPMTLRAEQFMTHNPITTLPGELLAAAEARMHEAKISSLIVADSAGKVVGVLNIHDL